MLPLFFSFYRHTSTHIYPSVPQYRCAGQRAILGSQFFPSAKRGWGMELRLPGSLASAETAQTTLPEPLVHTVSNFLKSAFKVIFIATKFTHFMCLVLRGLAIVNTELQKLPSFSKAPVCPLCQSLPTPGHRHPADLLSVTTEHLAHSLDPKDSILLHTLVWLVSLSLNFVHS